MLLDAVTNDYFFICLPSLYYFEFKYSLFEKNKLNLNKSHIFFLAWMNIP